MEISS